MSAAQSVIRVVLIDDHHLLRLGVVNLLTSSNDFTLVGEASDGLAGLQLIEKKRPDLVILDITMEGLSGLDMIQPILSLDSTIKIIIYSMHDDPKMISTAMKTGSSGYVMKSDPVEELLKGARAVFDNTTYLSSSATSRLLSSVISGVSDGVEDTVLTDSYSTLSPREKELSSLIAKGYTTRQIGEVLFISPKTVRVHRANIMKKLTCSSASELTVLLRDIFHPLQR